MPLCSIAGPYILFSSLTSLPYVGRLSGHELLDNLDLRLSTERDGDLHERRLHCGTRHARRGSLGMRCVVVSISRQSAAKISCCVWRKKIGDRRAGLSFGGLQTSPWDLMPHVVIH